MKYKPGPWNAYPYEGCVMIANEDGEFIEYPMNGKEFEGEVKATAELIAAAPELLETLKGLLELGKKDLSNPKYDGYFVSARAAVRSAEGDL